MPDAMTPARGAAPAAGPAPDGGDPPATAITIRPQTIWLAVAIAAAAALIAIVAIKAFGILLLLFFAITLAEAIRPAVETLRRLRIPRPLGTLLVYLTGLAILGALAWLLVQPAIDQAATLQAQLPDYLAALQQLVGQVQQAASENPAIAQLLGAFASQVGAQASALLPGLVSIPLTALGIPFAAFVVLSGAFFWLNSTRPLKPFLLGLLPAAERAGAGQVMEELGRSLGGYIRGLLTNMVIIGVLTGVGVYALGVPYALLIGIAAGLFEIIPFIGPWISGLIAVLVALANGGWAQAGAVVLLFFVLQQLEGSVIVPLVMRGVVRLNPFLTLAAVLIGGAVLGLFGAILAVPFTLVIRTLVVRVLAPLARRKSAEMDARGDAPSDAPNDAPGRRGAEREAGALAAVGAPEQPRPEGP